MDHRQDYINFVMIAPCEKALSGLTKQRPSPVKAAMDAFDKDWNKRLQPEFYRARYDLKPVSTDAKCKEIGRVYQIHLLGGKYRALLMFVEEQWRAIWLDVFVKNPTDQNRHIDRACDRAIRLRELSKNE